jgi:dienelactone hydrolase
MGYCLGGRLAFMMAEQSGADANISYYGVGLDNLLGDLAKVTKPLLVHIADKGLSLDNRIGRIESGWRQRRNERIHKWG